MSKPDVAETALQRPLRHTVVKLVRRAFIFGWLVLAVVGAANHTIDRTLLDPSSPLIQWLPHLRYGYVMFNTMPRKLPVLRYTRDDPDFGPPRPVSDLVDTPAPGYGVARTAVNLLNDQKYLSYLCATNPKADGANFQVDLYEVEPPARLVKTFRLDCRARRLRARR